jgi:hypothetical protein
MVLGSGIRKKPIPNPGSRGQIGTGSGSATLLRRLAFILIVRIAQARGDAFTWLVSLEARAGALASMHSFITSCPELLTEDIVRRLAVPIEAALNLLTLLSGMTHHHAL